MAGHRFHVRSYPRKSFLDKHYCYVCRSVVSLSGYCLWSSSCMVCTREYDFLQLCPRLLGVLKQQGIGIICFSALILPNQSAPLPLTQPRAATPSAGHMVAEADMTRRSVRLTTVTFGKTEINAYLCTNEKRPAQHEVLSSYLRG